MHGLSLNVCPDMRYFDNIVPCGITDRSVASMKQIKEQRIRYYFPCTHFPSIHTFPLEYIISIIAHLSKSSFSCCLISVHLLRFDATQNS